MATKKLDDMPLTEVEQWFQILTFHIEANALLNVQKAVLLSSCGPQAFALITMLYAPMAVTDSDVTYNIIKDLVISHLQPKRIMYFECHCLHSMVQNDKPATIFLQR